MAATFTTDPAGQTDRVTDQAMAATDPASPTIRASPMILTRLTM
jgi:hypothetical protein